MEKQHGVCPWQAGSMLAGSLRRLFHNPRRIVEPYLSAGITAMDIGCGMGFFTLPMSEIAGGHGKVVAVDLQPQMLDGLTANAARAGINNIATHQCGKTALNLEAWYGAVDFALIFWMLHEVPDAERLIREVRSALSDNGKLLFVEPYVHVGAEKFQESLTMITNTGFTVISKPRIAISRTALLQKS